MATRNLADRKVPDGWLPPEAPVAWHRLEVRIDGASYRNYTSHLTAIISGQVELDGRGWVHLSIAHPKRMPSYEELKIAKERFLGDVMAYQVFAPRSEHVNLHSRALHLWHCLDGPALPDFTRGGESI